MHDQVALVRAKQRTGIVLDEKFDFATKDEQRVYSVFSNVEDAIRYARATVSERPDVECAIYGPGEIMLHHIR